MLKRGLVACGLAALTLVVGAASATPTQAPGASARAFALRIVPAGITAAAVSTPGDSAAFGSPGAYPDASGITWGSSTASALASTADGASASASAELTSLSLFGGEVTVTGIRGRVQAKAAAGAGSGDFAGTGVGSIVVNGQAMGASGRVALGDWGYAVIGGQGAAQTTTGWRGFVTALDIRLTAEHGGLPAGTQIQAGYAEAAVDAGTRQPPTPPAASAGNGKNAKKGAPEPDRLFPTPLRGLPKDLRPKLTPGRYVFPVYGPSSFSNDWQAPRAGVGWHHGTDIFAPLGAPVLAVTDGEVFSVGWNRIGGWRLWLRDSGGNQYYYAHLSAFSPLAVNGRRVRAGDVVGFVGTTGDAEGTPPHLHFEIHPVGLLSLGYDGAVNPYPYLLAWERLDDISFPAGATCGAALPISADAPKPAAILLHVSDISTASGLKPGAVSRAFAAPASAEGDGALVRIGETQPPTEGQSLPRRACGVVAAHPDD